MDRNNTFLKALLIVVLLLPSIIAFCYIHVFSVNVPFWDSWRLEIQLLENYYNGNLTFSQFLSYDNDSITLFPRIIILALGILTDYNVIFENFLAIILFILSLVLIFLMYIEDQGVSNRSLLLFIPVSFYFLNLYLVGNFLWSIHLCHALTLLGFVTAVYLIDKSPKTDSRFFLAIIAAIMGIFSFIAGLVILPVCFIQIILENTLERTKRLIIWGVFSIIIYSLYFFRYNEMMTFEGMLSGEGHVNYFLLHPDSAISAYFSSMGSNIFHEFLISQIFGIIILFIIIILLIANRRRILEASNLKWISFSLFSLILSIEIIITRLSIDSPIAIRYFLITFMLMVGLYCLSANMAFGKKINSSSTSLAFQSGENHQPFSKINQTNLIIFGMVLMLILIGIVGHTVQGIEYGKTNKNHNQELSYILLSVDYQNDEKVELLAPDAKGVRERASFLREHNLSVFSEPYRYPQYLPYRTSGSKFNIELINQKRLDEGTVIVINKTAEPELFIQGWSFDIDKNASASAVFIGIDGTFYPTRYHLNRPDVAAYFNNKRLKDTGFYLQLSSDIFPKGTHNITLNIISSDREVVYRPEKFYAIEVTE